MELTRIIDVAVWPFAALGLSALAIFVLWRGRKRVLWAMGLRNIASRNLYLGGVIGLAIILSPIWLVILYYAITSFFLITSEPVLSLPRDERVWHFMSVASVILTLAALVAAPMYLIRAFIDERRTATEEIRRVSDEAGNVTDRFANAVQQLGAVKTITRREFRTAYQRIPGGKIRRNENGNPVIETDARGDAIGHWDVWDEVLPNIEQRIGALFALEKISQSSKQDHIPVVETLCAYIRENAEARVEYLPESSDELPEYLAPRADIQMALRVIGRRSPILRSFEANQLPPFRLDLRGAQLPNADLRSSVFGPARFDRANLQGALLDHAQMNGADFIGANLRNAWAEDAQLLGAKFEEADMRGAWFVGADMSEAELDGTDLRHTRLRGANLTGVEMESAEIRRTDVAEANMTGAWLREVDVAGFDGLNQNQLGACFGDDTTTVPGGLTRPDWPVGQLTYMRAFELWQAFKSGAAVEI